MEQGEASRFRADSVNLLNILLKHWKILVIAGLVVFAISAALTYTITPLFRSTVVLYPTTNVVETRTLFGTGNTSTPLFGDETATEKVLQILKSDKIKNYLLGHYDLMNHYGISSKARYRYTMLDSRMKKYIVSRKTAYNSIEISVLDKDPGTAATMANDIASQVDTVFNQIVQEAGAKSYTAIENSYREQLAKIKSLEDSLKLTSISKVSPYTLTNLKAGSSNSSWASAAPGLTPEFLRLINIFESENENLSAIRSRLTEAEMLATQKLPYTHIINEAKVSEKKALPDRSSIVLWTVSGALLLVFFFLVVKESLSGNKV